MIGIAERENKISLLKKLTGKADVLLTVCTHRTIDIDVMSAIMQLAGASKHKFTWSPVRGDALLSRSRSRAASYFLLNTDADIMMFADDDVVFSPPDADKLIDDVVSGMDIVSGVYIQKGTIGKTWVQFDGQEIVLGKKSKCYEVEAVPTGFLAISRRVLEGLAKELPLCHPGTLNFYPFFQPYVIEKNGKPIFLGEDWAFSHLARKHGYKVYLDGSILLKHKGEYQYDIADSIRQPKQRLEDIEITLK